MMMILRLQREKAETQMEAWQFKFLSEDKMVHDVEEMVAFEDSLYGREQVIQSLTCEVQAYKYRMMSYGLTYSKVKCLNGGYSRNQSISDFGGQIEYPSCAYHAPRCNLNDMKRKTDFEDDAINVEKYPSGEAPQSPAHLKNLEYRINQLERSSCSSQLDGVSGTRNILEKVSIGCSPSRPRHSRRFSTDSTNSFLTFPDYITDSPRLDSFKKMDCIAEVLRKLDNASEFGDDMSDRVYTIDSLHHRAQYNNVLEADLGDIEMKKLYLRLQALEADRESLKQTIILMQTDKT